jgi:hypothetical protein
MTDTTEELDRLRRNVRPALLSWLAKGDEWSLRRAYELGRDALSCSVGLLDVVRVHEEVQLEVMRSATDVPQACDIAAGATAFLIEMAAPFEMARRGFMDLASPAAPAPEAAP